MSFKSSGPKTRPDPVKPRQPSLPTDSIPQPPTWATQGKSKSRRSSTSSTSSSDSFHSARFDPLEESAMIASSHSLKAQANTQFAKQDYTQAISTYDRALAELPNYLDYEMAVLQSNIAACHLKLEQWKSAVQSCEKGLQGLERELPTAPKKTEKGKKSKQTNKSQAKAGGLNSDTESEDEPSAPIPPQTDDQVVELDSSADEADMLAKLNLSDQRKADIHRIRTKLLLRRARARSSLPFAKAEDPAQNDTAKSRFNPDFVSTWSSLSSALADYQLLSTPPYFNTLPPSDQKTVRQALVSLPPQVEKAKEHEVGEMMGKLKDLGNGILKPFGLSTDMFKVQQGEGGGYSLNFDAGGGGGKK
ncbi:hypothetical protein B0A52_09737 [Exophiala mesophila]|uniref:Tetratricopeptide repeat protein 1 n=1 Tax=Exophiala mesophila TaxID=212818 RepID=A0A438MRP1_EXOME|nr:hypothetical protein B0A52_09737 [Exophiala mesophila]